MVFIFIDRWCDGAGESKLSTVYVLTEDALIQGRGR